MFTGIVTDIGTITLAEPRGDLRVRIATAYDSASVALGASIACSGVCLTVVDKGADNQGDWFEVDVSAETRARSAPGMWAPGRRLNLERALRVGDELGGHIVTGHVDGVGTVTGVTEIGGSKRFDFAAPRDLAPYLAPKGSVALDGASLTINTVADTPDSVAFSVNIIPHTAEWTTFGAASPGDPVNIEIDVLARYLGRMRDALTA